VITGRALYSGTLDFNESLAVARSNGNPWSGSERGRELKIEYSIENIQSLWTNMWTKLALYEKTSWQIDHLGLDFPFKLGRYLILAKTKL
jgi:hypothetical protein